MWSLRAQSACISLVIMLGWKAVTHSRNVRGSVISVKRLAVSHLETPVINSESIALNPNGLSFNVQITRPSAKFHMKSRM